MERTWTEIAAAVSLLREVVSNDGDGVGLSDDQAEDFLWLTDVMLTELAERLRMMADKEVETDMPRRRMAVN
jgi:hypothetical protein